MKPQSIEAKIAVFNTLYKKASAQEKRVLIAKDALAQLKIGNIKATHDYGYPWRKYGQININQGKLLGGLKCNACAAGTLFLSAVRFRNQFEQESVVDCDALGTREFSKSQMAQIEDAFESDEEFGYWTGVKTKAAAFGLKYKDTTKKLEAILRNIIKNKGTFIP